MNGSGGEQEKLKPDAPKYPHPKILMVDLPKRDAETLEQAGYRVERGTFGSPIRVVVESRYLPLPRVGVLPNYTEQEIVVVDCATPSITDRTLKAAPPGEYWMRQKASHGVIDPRPWAMLRSRKSFDRVLDYGGVFVCFVDYKTSIEFLFTRSANSTIYDEDIAALDTWGFLSVLASIESDDDQGGEIQLTKIGEDMPGLKGALGNCPFTTTIKPDGFIEGSWLSLAENKFGNVVSGLIAANGGDRRGYVFLLPRVADKGVLLKQFLEELLPTLTPDLFPHIQKSGWVREAPYELPGIEELQGEIKIVQKEASEKAKELEDKIKLKREDQGFLHDLLTASGDELVAAVKQALELLGFRDVRDADEEAEDKKALREDLQIWERSPTLIIEVKGITGLPKEEDALQVTKYLAPRMKEWDRTDVQGLAILNHQNRMVGLEREREKVFQPDVLTNAETHQFGLITTWSLFRLARAYLRYSWQPEQVTDLFYKHGVIKPVPAHYELVGTINQFYEEPGALTIHLAQAINVGEILAYELPVEFEQEQIASLQVNDESVASADAGSEVGIKTELTKAQARKGVRVYRVNEG